MDKSLNTHETPDITQEEYRGPGPKVTALGQGAIDHLTWGFAGLGIGTAVAALFHKQLQAPLNNLRHTLSEAAEHENSFVKFWARLARDITGRGQLPEATYTAVKQMPDIDSRKLKYWVQEQETGFGLWFYNHLIGFFVPPMRRFVSKQVEKEWVRTAFTTGGALGLIGYIGGWVNAAFTGSDHAQRGRKQFEHAQQEIIDQREINAALREKYIQTKLELEDLKTIRDTKNGVLHVTKDNPAPKPHAGDAPTELTPPPDAINVRPHGDQQFAKTHRDHAAEHHANHDRWSDKVAAQKSHAPELETERA